MFLVNSRLGRFAATSVRFKGQALSRSEAPLLPKLRGQFAEFLDGGSLDHLRAFTLAYLCRFAVRAPMQLDDEAFLASVGSTESP